LNWRPPSYDWNKKYKRIATHRYCTSYRKTNYKTRNVNACADWARLVDPYARYFFFREEGNYHCAPCPRTYTGHPTTGTGYQNSKIYTYRILHWRQPTGSWSKWYRRVAINRYCTGYKKPAFNHRTVENCGTWVRSTAGDPYARYFFFREEGNYHCSPCPQTYRGHPTTGTGYQNSRIYTYRILNWKRPVYPWEKWYRRVALNRYCTGYQKSAFNHRSVINCANWVRKVDPEARYFFFREQSNWHCSPCPLYYTGGTQYTAEDKNTRIHIYKITGWRAPTFGW
jgi:hypothetical protein